MGWDGYSTTYYNAINPTCYLYIIYKRALTYTMPHPIQSSMYI